jgi:hypothetical protein
MERCRRVLGRDHATTLFAAAALTRALYKLGEAEPARTLGEDTLERCRRVLRSNHTTTLITAAVLTRALQKLGEAEPARTLGEDTLERCRRVLGDDHPLTHTAARILDAGDHIATPLTPVGGLGDDGVGVLGPGERCAAVVPGVDEPLNGGDEVGDGGKVAAAQCLPGEDRENASTRFSYEPEVRV